MAKRGRKPKERKGYFYETEEQAIVDYINEKNDAVRNEIFNTILHPALTTMIESIIRRYKLFIPDEDFDENFNDTISYLLTKIDHFRPVIVGYDEMTDSDVKKIDEDEFIIFTEDELREKYRDATDDDPEYIKVSIPKIVYGGPGYVEYSDDEYTVKYYKKVLHNYKAYSYCGTVCKNYLMYKSSQYVKKRQRNAPYDDVYEEISNNIKYSTEETSYAEVAEALVGKISNEIETMINAPEKFMLNENEITVGKALVDLLRNWEEVLPDDGSNKLQKSSILYFLREETMMTTKEVRDNMRKFKNVFILLKKAALE